MTDKQEQDTAPPPNMIPIGWTMISDEHFDALAEGMAEIKAAIDGKSDQSIASIIEVVPNIIASVPSPVQGTALPLGAHEPKLVE